MAEVQPNQPATTQPQEERKDGSDPKQPRGEGKGPWVPRGDGKPREPREPRGDGKPREPREPREPRGDGKPREPREPREPRGEGKPREPREPRQPRQLYVPKGEGGEQQPLTEEQEKKKQERKDQRQQKKQQREEKYVYDKNAITLETVVPELPKKHEEIQKPSRDDLNKKLDEIDNQIDKIHEHLHNYINEVRLTMAGLKDRKDALPLREMLRNKVSQQKEISQQFKQIKIQFDDKKNELNTLYDDGQKYRQKMKNLDRAEDIIKELASLKYRQENEYLSVNEEKAICKQIGDLEKSLPYAQPLEEIEKKMERIRQEKKQIGKVMNQYYEKLKEFDKDIQEYQDDLENMKKSKEDSQKSLDPVVQSKKQEFREQIDKLKDKKKALVEAFHNQYDKYDDQQDFIRYVEWAARHKERLLKTEKRRKDDEARKAREEQRAKRIAERDAKEKAIEDEEANKPKANPYLDHIDLCDQLISYCQQFLPQQQQQQQQQQQRVNIEDALKSDEWKKEKVQVVKTKDEREEDLFAVADPKRKRKGAPQQKKPQEQTNEQQQQKPKEQILQHNLNTIQFFETVKIATPFYPSDLEKTIKSIQERKEYYQNPPESDKVEPEQQSGEQDNQRKPKQKGGRNQKKVDLNEEEFPGL